MTSGVCSHQHDDGGDRSLFSAHRLQLPQRPDQEHGAEITADKLQLSFAKLKRSFER